MPSYTYDYIKLPTFTSGAIGAGGASGASSTSNTISCTYTTNYTSASSLGWEAALPDDNYPVNYYMHSKKDPYHDVKKLIDKRNPHFVNWNSFFNDGLHVHDLCLMSTDSLGRNKDDDITQYEIALTGESKRGNYYINTWLTSALMDRASEVMTNGPGMFESVLQHAFNWIIISQNMLQSYLQNSNLIGPLNKEVDEHGLALIENIATPGCPYTKIFVSSLDNELNWVLAGNTSECMFEWDEPLFVKNHMPKCMFNLVLKNRSNLLYYRERKQWRNYANLND